MATPTSTSETLEQFALRLLALENDELKALIERRHPEYEDHTAQWKFIEDTYHGGREWFAGNVFKYVKEGEAEYKERIARAYRFNHTREVVDLVNKYIFKGNIVRPEDKVSSDILTFWQSATLNRRPVDDFMQLVSTQSSIFGRIWICVDTNQSDPNATILSTKKNGARVYAYIIKPQNVLDLAYDTNGAVKWLIVREYKRDDADFTSSGSISVQYRIWTQNHWALIAESHKDNKTVYEIVDLGAHDLGRVPVFSHDHTQSDNPYCATGLADDIAYLDRAVANYLSNLDAIIQDQTFSQLVIPAQSLMPEDDAYAKVVEMGTKRAFTYDSNGGAAPQYISPDASNAQTILDVISKIINEIYHSVGMAGERTKQDNSMGIDNSSGVAKAYDFDRMNAMLASKARSLEITENTLCEIVDLWHGRNVEPGSYTSVVYPDNFDIRGLADELDLAKALMDISAPDGVRKEQMNGVIDKLFPGLSDKLIDKMKAEVKSSWPPEIPTPVEAAPKSPQTKPAKESRQGQVTKDTPQ